MRNAPSGVHGALLDSPQLNAYLDTVEDWLWNGAATDLSLFSLCRDD
jgi:hypothetical protein